MFLIAGHGHPVLFPDRAKAGQLSGDVLAYLHGRGDQDRAKAGGIIHQQLCPRVPPKDRVLHPAARRGHIEPLAVPAEPVRAQMRAPIAADPSDNGVTPLSQERPDLVGRCHIPSRYRAAVAWWAPPGQRHGKTIAVPAAGAWVMAHRRVMQTAESCIFGPVLAWLGSSSGSIRRAGSRT